MTAINFPVLGPAGTTWTDPNGQTWMSNGDGWVRTKLGTGIEEPVADGKQYSRQRDTSTEPGKWVRVAIDVWYLGGWPDNPTTNNDGNPLVEGNVYYNTTIDTMLSWDGVEWKTFSPTLQVFGLIKYSYAYDTEAPVAGVPISGPDVYGNTPIGWSVDETVLDVYSDGVRMVEQRDAGVLAGDYTIDYTLSQIIPVGTWTTGTVVIVVSKKDSDKYIAKEDESAQDWAFVVEDFNAPVDHTKLVTQQGIKEYVATTGIALKNEIETGLHTGYKNQIINGTFIVNERLLSSSVDHKYTGQGYFIDRWYSNSTKQSYRLVTNTDHALPFDRFIQVGRQEIDSSRYIFQGVELPKVGHIGPYTPGSEWTVSFWVSATLPGDAHFELQFAEKMSDFSGQRIASGIVTGLTSGWQKVSFTFTLPSNLVIRIADRMLRLAVWSSISAGTGTGTNFANFANVQFEKGNNATEIEYRAKGLELSLCQRYYARKILIGASGYADETGQTGACLASFTYPQSVYQNPAFEINKKQSMNGTGSILVVDYNYRSAIMTMTSAAAGRIFFQADVTIEAEMPI